MPQQLNEDLTLTPYEIDSEVRAILESFQELAAVLVEFYHSGKYIDKRGSLQNLETFNKLKERFKKFHNYPFVSVVARQIQQIEDELKEREEARATDSSTDDFFLAYQRAKSVFLKRDAPSAVAVGKEMYSMLANKKIAKKTDSEILKHKWNPMYIENPLIFQTTNFLKVFERSELETVINRDLNEYRYSYLKLPESAHSDFQFVAYFILQLQNTPEPKTVGGTLLANYFRMAYSDKDYADMMKNVSSYLRDNDKSLLPKILEQMQQFPEIVDANNDSLSKIDRVYRGIPLLGDEWGEENQTNQLSKQDVVRKDRKSEYVATSDSKRAAANFAMMKGHLESDEARRSEVGYIIEYEVDGNSLVLDTSIFGGYFNEDEIIIRPGKAKVVKVAKI